MSDIQICDASVIVLPFNDALSAKRVSASLWPNTQGTKESCGLGSSVGVATDYGLDGPGSNPGGDEISRTSRPTLGPTQPTVKWVPRFSRG